MNIYYHIILMICYQVEMLSTYDVNRYTEQSIMIKITPKDSYNLLILVDLAYAASIIYFEMHD